MGPPSVLYVVVLGSVILPHKVFSHTLAFLYSPEFVRYQMSPYGVRCVNVSNVFFKNGVLNARVNPLKSCM